MKKITTCILVICAPVIVFCQKYRLCMKTTLGNIKIELYDGTPKHRDNYVKLARQHFFDSLLFHRVIPKFMIQAGDPESKNAAKGTMLGDGGPKYTIPAEIMPDKYFHKRGALGAARENNPAKASAASQFYIVTGKTFTDSILDKTEERTHYKISDAHRKIYEQIGGAPHLDNNYTVFGEVLKGMDVADKIADVKRDRNDRPLEDVRILKLRVKKRFLFWWW
jgi:peptidyl-prolyl cis-trans isomerase B (cyclophilin B)